MKINDIISTYFGWCPRFDVNLTRSTILPVTNLSTVGRVVIATILASWGLFSILAYGNSYTLEMLKYSAYSLQAAVYTIIAMLSTVSGMTLLVLLGDYTRSRSMIPRHRRELFIVLLSQAAYWLLAPLNIIMTYLAGTQIDQAATLIFNDIVISIPQALLFGYLTNRVRKGRGMLDGNAFLLITLALAAPFASALPYYLSSSRLDALALMNAGLWLFAYLVGAIFCLGVYLKSRGRTGFELTLPLYARLMIFIYALRNSGIFTFLLTGQAEYLLFISGNTCPISYKPYFVFFLGLMIAAFMPISLRVGEPNLAPEGRI